jgi:hypothetical protein
MSQNQNSNNPNQNNNAFSTLWFYLVQAAAFNRGAIQNQYQQGRKLN